MDVFLITSEGKCGIAEHSAYLREAVEAADPTIGLRGNPDFLDPHLFFTTTLAPMPQIVHLNYQSAIHSRWHPEHIRQLQSVGVKVVVTWHDSGVPNSDHCKSIYAVADAFVVHEPCEDLPGAIYWRQGIPAPVAPDRSGVVPRRPGRPLLGSLGFALPWKQYHVLAEASAAAGWDLMLIAPGATLEQALQWQALNPYTVVFNSFVRRDDALAFLTSCDATAFMYANCNTGTSGAIRQGIATRKPVIASNEQACRQNRDLTNDDLAMRAITWIQPDVEHLTEALSRVRIAPVDAGMVALAERDSWKGLGVKYANLYKELVNA